MIADLVQLYVSRGVDLPKIIQNVVDKGSITNLEELLGEPQITKKDESLSPYKEEKIVSNIKFLSRKSLKVEAGEVEILEKEEIDYLKAVSNLIEKLNRDDLTKKVFILNTFEKDKESLKNYAFTISKNQEVTLRTLNTIKSTETPTAYKKEKIVESLLKKSDKDKYVYFSEIGNKRIFEAESYDIPDSLPFFKKAAVDSTEALEAAKKVAENAKKKNDLAANRTFCFGTDEKDTSIDILSKLANLPDFMTNKYTAVLLPAITEKDKNIIDNYLSVLKEFCFRVEGIEIPISKRTAFETKFLNTSIKRLEPTVETKRDGSLNIRLDEKGRLEKLLKGFEEKNTYYPSPYGNKKEDLVFTHENMLMTTEDIKPGKTAIESIINSSRKLNKHLEWTLVVVQPMYDLEKTVEYFSSGQTQLDNCKIKSYTPGLEKKPSKQTSPTIKGLKGAIKYNIYTFENVRFLGQTQALQYKSEGANTLNGAFKFVFRKVISQIVSPKKSQ